tara:strand:- start:204 stop:1010 length:807 start_codon:yes stop_codon:yes gene_type:complete
MTDKHTSESGHWYTQEGEPMYTITGANGKERNTTLADARKLGLVPSVTGIIGVSAKPALERWKITEAIKSTMVLNIESDETIDEYVSRCREHSKLVGTKSAERGSEIHYEIEQGFVSGKESEPYLAIMDWLDDNYPLETWIAEEAFCAKQGYGGKIDLYSKRGIFIDFKTKDDLKGKDPKRLVYDEHGMQLSAYAQGCGYEKAERVSIFIDREDTSLIACHIWDDTHEKHKDMFNSLLRFWKLNKNYDPVEQWTKIESSIDKEEENVS